MLLIFTSVAREVATPTKLPTPPSLHPDIDETDFPDFTRKDIPSESPDPALVRRLQRLWVQKKEIEGDMQHALQCEDERTYRALESQHSNVNARMFSFLHASFESQKAKAPPQSSSSVAPQPQMTG